MNYYDDENLIIRSFQLYHGPILFFPHVSTIMRHVFDAVYEGSKWEKWTDNSGKGDAPPDFFSNELQLMMEVMRVDDHAFISGKGRRVNPTNEKESKLQKKIRSLILKGHPYSDLSEFPIRITTVSGLPSKQDHNYEFYYNNFKYTLEKHIQKIESYRNNHPDKDLIFFVFDESTAYIQAPDEDTAGRDLQPFEYFEGSPLWHFLDKRFVDVFKDCNIDYLIWFTPNKYFHGSSYQNPGICVFNLKNFDESLLENYPMSLIISSEA